MFVIIKHLPGTKLCAAWLLCSFTKGSNILIFTCYESSNSKSKSTLALALSAEQLYYHLRVLDRVPLFS